MSQTPCAIGSPEGLRGLLHRVWLLADGRRSLPQIAREAMASLEQVADALDLLDHVGLLSRADARAQPPALPAWLSAAAGRPATGSAL